MTHIFTVAVGQSSQQQLAHATRKEYQVQKLSQPEIERELVPLNGWQLDQGKLYREFVFPEFSQAVGFIAAVSVAAESMQHHPDWFNHYTSVKVWLHSHDVGGISAADVELARRMNSLYFPK